MLILEVTQTKISEQIVYHGSDKKIAQFNIPSWGVFFSPHKKAALNYGPVLTYARVLADRVYKVDFNQDIDEDIFAALFDRDYKTLTNYIELLRSTGYQALQTVSDSEMICVFPGTKIEVIGQGN
jgi:hypothetical protein